MAEIYELLGFTEEVEITGLQLREMFLSCKLISEQKIPTDYIRQYEKIKNIATDFNNLITKIENIKNNLMENYKNVISDFNPDSWRNIKEDVNIKLYTIFKEARTNYSKDDVDKAFEDISITRCHITDIVSYPDDSTLESKARRSLSEFERNYRL